MEAGQLFSTRTIRSQGSEKTTHQTTEQNATVAQDSSHVSMDGFAPGIPQLLIYRDALGRDRHVSLQVAIQAARDDQGPVEGRFLSRFLSPSAAVAEEVLRRRHNREIELKQALGSEPRLETRSRQASRDFMLGEWWHGAGNRGELRTISPVSSGTGVTEVPLRWRTAAARSVGESSRLKSARGEQSTWLKSKTVGWHGKAADLEDSMENENPCKGYKIQIDDIQERQETTKLSPGTAESHYSSVDVTPPPVTEHAETMPAVPTRPVSAAQPRLRGQPSHASFNTTASFSSYASTVSLSHVDAQSNLLDIEAMGGFFTVQQQRQQGEDSEDARESFGTRAGIFRPLGCGIAAERNPHGDMAGNHSRECTERCWNVRGEKGGEIWDAQDDDYVMVERPRV